MNVDNVIILGAGASFDAGIPLMNGFIEKMRLFALKDQIDDVKLTIDDKEVFKKAISIMNELDTYHARAAFNDRNLEDILSILAFNILGGKSYTKIKLDNMIKAIARTIEITCSVKHDGKLNSEQMLGDIVFRNFWSRLFEKYEISGSFPTIITLNYDLVLERSLLQTFVTTKHKQYSFDGIVLKYYYPPYQDSSYRIKTANYTVIRDGSFSDTTGTILEKCQEKDLLKPVVIEILKLHGSLNFPKQPNENHEVYPISQVVDSPFIIPPISNKSLSIDSEKIWKTALERISNCKNLVIVGYSLPKTDIYFQFFLKAALGPNKDFDKLIIYNPEIFSDLKNCDLKKRYINCFPEQLQERIEFPTPMNNSNNLPGSFKHFVLDLHYKKDLFF